MHPELAYQPYRVLLKLMVAPGTSEYAQEQRARLLSVYDKLWWLRWCITHHNIAAWRRPHPRAVARPSAVTVAPARRATIPSAPVHLRCVLLCFPGATDNLMELREASAAGWLLRLRSDLQLIGAVHSEEDRAAPAQTSTQTSWNTAGAPSLC